MGLKQRLRTDLTAAIKGQDELTKATLRMALSAITAAEVAGDTARELDEPEVLKVLTREVKKRAEASEAFDAAGRGELAAKERAEADVLSRYLPTQLDDAEVAAIAERAVNQVAAQLGERPGMRQMGQVMKVASAEVAGRAEGSRVAAAVKARLAG
ncbi:MAG: GatB/YqeY domain-containing protein [Pseudonocardia sp.]|nr:GatB/YqeY domain-containing protein [Pseudonocardia sp.]